MIEYRKHDQVILVSEIGGAIASWQYRGVDIFFPQQEVVRGGERKIRGGMHACFPNFDTVDPKFGLPHHGPLRTRRVDEVRENSVYFRGTDLLCSNCEEECEVVITVLVEPNGFLYTLAARLAGPSSKEVFVNPGLHPYFRTPEGEALVSVRPTEQIRICDLVMEPRYESTNEESTFVTIPGLGRVEMVMSGDGWNSAAKPQIVLWRDAFEYLCVEPVLGVPQTYGSPTCTRLTEEWFEITCQFEVVL